MAHQRQLPCDGDGICMVCNNTPSEGEALTCKTCATPWHVDCLCVRPPTLADTLNWECPDCSLAADPTPAPPAGAPGSSGVLVAAIRAIESDHSLTEHEKAKRRQRLLSGPAGSTDTEVNHEVKKVGDFDVLDILGGSLNCSFCMQLPERPVTTPCGHNFCLKCFQKWIGQGKLTCANCRHEIPPKMARGPRINSALVTAIRMAKMLKSGAPSGPQKIYYFVHNQDRPDKAYTTERAKKSGKANACSGRIFVTVPPDHFGPILADNDPSRNQGVLVGESWEDRLECRQWGAHLPMVGGIAGQSKYGAQSVALSGGYIDDEDHGEWFLYTGSGGRDLSGNKRTNKEQSSDQVFLKYNEALRVSCREGYPVRVVRSHKEKRSSYAPEKGVRYDGIYRIEKCWHKVGTEGFKLCRYLFVRCDNDPAPWSSDEYGDRPRPLPVIKELKGAINITERKTTPSWDYDEEKGCWMWKKTPPRSKKRVVNNANDDNSGNGKRTIKFEHQVRTISVRERLLKEFSCLICRNVMNFPLTTPCAHNFCKSCLEGAFAGQTFMRERTCGGRRTLRAQKNIMKCPSCSNDISDFLKNPQVNRELMGVIESLKGKEAEEAEEINEMSAEEAEEIDEMLADEAEETDEISAEETNDVENPDAVAAVAEISDVNSELLEDAEEVVPNSETETKTRAGGHKRKKGSADGMSNFGTKRSRISAEKPDADGHAEPMKSDDNKAEAAPDETKLEQIYEEKEANGGSPCEP